MVVQNDKPISSGQAIGISTAIGAAAPAVVWCALVALGLLYNFQGGTVDISPLFSKQAGMIVLYGTAAGAAGGAFVGSAIAVNNACKKKLSPELPSYQDLYPPA